LGLRASHGSEQSNFGPLPSIEYQDFGIIAPPASLLKKMLAAVLNKDEIDKVVGALGGLSVKDALNTVRITRARDNGKLSAEGAIVTRRSMLKESKGLSLVDPYMPAYLPDPQLEKFCKDERQFFFSPGDARLRPRGLLFDGPPGCGKTLGAKYIAREWGIPLFRLSEQFLNMWQGQSEGFFEMALKTAEHAAPNVLLIDDRISFPVPRRLPLGLLFNR
jgi:hypothetical protein